MQPEIITLGLPKKNDQNTIQDIKEKRYSMGGTVPGINVVQQFEKSFVEDMRKNPEDYFNFGFTFNDFKAYLMKIMYCRAVRNFIEKERIKKIDEYNQSNQGSLSYGLEKYEGGGGQM